MPISIHFTDCSQKYLFLSITVQLYDCTVRGTEYCTITLINKLTPSLESAAPLLLSLPLSSLLRAAPPRRLGRLILRMEAERVRAIRAGAPLAAIIPTAWRQRGGARRLGVRRFARRGRRRRWRRQRPRLPHFHIAASPASAASRAGPVPVHTAPVRRRVPCIPLEVGARCTDGIGIPKGPSAQLAPPAGGNQAQIAVRRRGERRDDVGPARILRVNRNVRCVEGAECENLADRSDPVPHSVGESARRGRRWQRSR